MGYVVVNPNPENNLVGDCVIRAISIDGPWNDAYIYRCPRMSPQQVGQQLLNSWQLIQEDFKSFSVIANRLTWRKQ